MRSPKIRYSPWSSSSGKVKAKARAKERREYAGTVVKVITTAEVAPMTNKTSAGQMVEAWKNQKGSRTDKDAGKGWDACKSNWNSWGDSKGKGAKAKTGKGVVSPKNGKVRTDKMIGAHQRGKARAARVAAAKAAHMALKKLVTLIGGRNQTDHSTVHNLKKKSTSAR